MSARGFFSGRSGGTSIDLDLAAAGVVGCFVVESTAVGTPSAIWVSDGARSGLTRREYRAYFAGAKLAVAINVGKVCQLDEPLTLSELRRRNPTFQVPQSYRFMAIAELGVVLNRERSALLG